MTTTLQPKHEFIKTLITCLNELNYTTYTPVCADNDDYTLSITSPANTHFTFEYVGLSSTNGINATASIIRLSAHSDQHGDIDCSILEFDPLWVDFCYDIIGNAEHTTIIANHIAFIIYALETVERHYGIATPTLNSTA